MITIEGYVGKLVHSNGDFKIYGFYPLQKYIPLLKINEVYGNISINGIIPELYEDVIYKMDVEYSKKGIYDNYEVKKIYTTEKVNLDMTTKFLYSIITESQANELLKHYPDIINMIIKDKPIDTSILKGIKDKTMSKIKNKVIENFKLIELVEEYSDYGMTFTMMKNLYDNYSSIKIIKQKMEEDPYTCLCELNRVGFKTADKFIMRKFPQKIDSYMRAKACMRYILNENETKGNTWISIVELYKQFKELAPESSKHFNSILNEDSIYFDDNTKRVANYKTYMCEKEVCNRLLKFKNKHTHYDINYREYCEIDGFPITEEQMQILKNICNNNLNLLVGYAGSGKTYSTKALINMLDDNMITYMLMSPTGKASKVLAKNTKRNASTIHRGLSYKPQEGFEYNENNKLPYDVIIIDEYSMVDIFLLRDLLRAIDYNSKIVFIGDPAQIPSVSMGNVAFDMLQSKMISTSLLTKVFRYGEGGLSYVATKIREGKKYLENNNSLQTYGNNKDYTFINVAQENSIKYVNKLYSKLLNNGNTIDDIMVLTSMNKGEYGTVKINSSIQELVNPKTNDTNEIKVLRNKEEVIFRTNDKVMQIKNNYKSRDCYSEKEHPVFNGDVGTIETISNNKIIVNFDGYYIEYEKGDLDQLNLAYCLTIHKSQGSQAKNIILVTPKAHKFFLDRNLLYVAVTRAEKTLYHIGTTDVIECAIKKSQNFERNTFLCELLQSEETNPNN